MIKLIKFLVVFWVVFLYFFYQNNKTIQDKNYLRVIVSPDNKPFTYFDLKQDKITGHEIDFIYKVAKKMGKKVKLIPTEFSFSILALKQGIGDVVISAITPTPERSKSVLFTKPYYKGKMILISKQSQNSESVLKLLSITNNNNEKSYNEKTGSTLSTKEKNKDIINSKFKQSKTVCDKENQDTENDKKSSEIDTDTKVIKIGVQISTTISLYLEKSIKNTNIKIVYFNTIPEMFESLKCNAISYIAIDSSVKSHIDPNFHANEIPGSEIEYCMAVTNPEIKNQINKSFDACILS